MNLKELEIFLDQQYFQNANSLILSINLHDDFKSKGWHPGEFVEYIVGADGRLYSDWGSAIVKVADYIDNYKPISVH